MAAVALGEVFVEADAEQVGEPCGNERSEVALLVSALGRGNDAPVAGGERVAQDLSDKGIHTLGKFLHHIVVALNVGQGSAVD